MTFDEIPAPQGRDSMPPVQEVGFEEGSASRSNPPGLLYVEMDCPSEIDDEFHAWYNTEHVPERLGLPGFINGRRFTSLTGGPRWLASYDLESTSALESPDYLRIMGKSRSIGTRRVSFYCQVRRAVYELSWAAGAAPFMGDGPNERGLLAVRYNGNSDQIASFHLHHDQEVALRLLELDRVLAIRRYQCKEPGPEYLLLYQLADPWVVQEAAFHGPWAEAWAALRNTTSMSRRTLYIRIL